MYINLSACCKRGLKISDNAKNRLYTYQSDVSPTINAEL